MGLTEKMDHLQRPLLGSDLAPQWRGLGLVLVGPPTPLQKSGKRLSAICYGLSCAPKFRC